MQPKGKGKNLMFDNILQQQRMQKAKDFSDEGIKPYPHFLHKEFSLKEFKEKFAYISSLDEKRDEKAFGKVAGRIKLLRIAGKSIFANIEDENENLQIYFSKDSIGEEKYKVFKRNLEVGDIIIAKGFPFTTKTDEFSLHVSEIILASKSITPLPEKYHGLIDKEQRYRKRYLDMIMNAEIRKDFVIRSKIISVIRHFFENKGFLEVETPMMHPIAGGANAKPFVTFHNALDVERFLRIAPELYLKRLIIGGYEAVFEINRCFRNEGMDLTHNPEFTTIEFYWAYHTYKDLMNLTEELFTLLLKELHLEKIIEFDGEQIDFSKPFERISYKDALKKYGGLDTLVIENKNELLKKLQKDGFEANEKLDLGHLQAELFDNYVEDKLIQPTFITDFPISISPLSRRSDENSEIAERFELFICKREIANGFNELNDPFDQYERFLKQIEAKNAGNEESCEMDEDFIEALSYGMPPTAGQGIGIDRLVMLLTNKKSIRDVILFPAMRALKTESKEGEKNEFRGI